MNETFGAAMCYVILSRIMCLKILVLAPFNQAKIYCNKYAIEGAFIIVSAGFQRCNQ